MRSHYKSRKNLVPHSPVQRIVLYVALAFIIGSVAVVRFNNQEPASDTSGDGYNLLLNSGFEGMDGADGAAYWQAFGAILGSESSSATRDLTVSHTGRSSLRIDLRTSDKTTESGVIQQLGRVPLSSTLNLDAQIKSPTSSPAFVRVYFLPAQGDKAIAINDSPAVASKRFFQHVQATIPVPADAGACYVALVVEGSGQAWFDNIRLTADEQWESKPPTEHVLSMDQFQNGDFEAVSGNFPVAWSAPDFENGFTCSVINDGYSGKAVRLSSSTTRVKPKAWTQQVRLSYRAGDDIVISGWVRTRTNSDSGIAITLLDDKLRTMGIHTTLADREMKGQWQKVSLSVSIPRDCVVANVELFLMDTGVVDFDQVSMNRE